MTSRALRRRCEQRVAALDIPRPFDIAELCARVGRQRGRPIRLLPADLPPDSPCGLWAATHEVDYVFYHAGTSRVHQEHIILHELGHILCDDGTGPELTDETAALLAPDLAPEMVRRLLGRTHYSDDEERAAETIATMIRERVARFSTAPEPPQPAPESTEFVRRIERSLQRRASER